MRHCFATGLVAALAAVLCGHAHASICAGVDPLITGSDNMRDVGVGATNTKTPGACDGTANGARCVHSCDYGFVGGSVVCSATVSSADGSVMSNTSWIITACKPDLDRMRGCDEVAYGLAVLAALSVLHVVWSASKRQRLENAQAVAEFVKRSFDEMDRNSDGKVSRDELAAAAKAQTGMVPPDDMIDKIMASMDDDSNGSISEKEFSKHFRMTKFMQHRRTLEDFCSSAGNRPPKPNKFRNIGLVDVNASSWKCGGGTGLCPCIKITAIAERASLQALRSGFTRAFLCAILAGVLSQVRIFYRLQEFREVLMDISASSRLTSADVDFVSKFSAATIICPAHLTCLINLTLACEQMMDSDATYLAVDALVENSWNVFSKLLFLPVFLLVYYLNNEIAQWRKIGSMMWAIQTAIENCGLIVSSAEEFAPDSEEAKAMYKFYRHLNLVHVLQYRTLDPRLRIECGNKLQGLVQTGLLHDGNLAKLVQAGDRDRTLAMSWLMMDVVELTEKLGAVKGPLAGQLVGNTIGLRANLANLHNEFLNRPPATMVGMMRIFVDGLLMLGIVGFAWALTALGKTTAVDLNLLANDACGYRYYLWPMLGTFILSTFFTTMFIIATTISDPLGNDLDDYDVDSLLCSTEGSLYMLIRSSMAGTPESDSSLALSAMEQPTEDDEVEEDIAFQGWKLKNYGSGEVKNPVEA